MGANKYTNCQIERIPLIGMGVHVLWNETETYVETYGNKTMQMIWTHIFQMEIPNSSADVAVVLPSWANVFFFLNLHMYNIMI